MPPGDGTILDMGGRTAAVQPRARGSVRLAVRAGARSSLADLYQSGSLKALFPRRDGAAAQAVLVNTAGGVTGGDRFETHVEVAPGAALTLTTQAAERAYRATGDTPGRIANSATVGGWLHWLPQETILFEGCNLSRRLTVDLGAQATALIVEPLIFGRLAMGETLSRARLSDRIEILRAGRPEYVDALAFGPDIARQLSGLALGKGAGALATVILAGDEAEGRLGRVRAMLPPTAGASLLSPRLLCARILAEDGFSLRRTLIPLLTQLSGDALPRPWMI